MQCGVSRLLLMGHPRSASWESRGQATSLLFYLSHAQLDGHRAGLSAWVSGSWASILFTLSDVTMPSLRTHILQERLLSECLHTGRLPESSVPGIPVSETVLRDLQVLLALPSDHAFQ